MGQVKSVISLNPAAWIGTRVQQESHLWQRYRPKSLVLEITSAASSFFGGQYLAAWSADYDDEIPDIGKAALSKLLSYRPSKTQAISKPLRLRIPISMTQKWYYLRGTEDKDSEYGKILIAITSPIANVNTGSSTELIVRIRWTYEFSFPELPDQSSPDDNSIFASAPNYFTDSSGDWKSGKILTFKWHEGGDIVGFPGAEPKKIYKISSKAYCPYYKTDGTLTKTSYAVCVPDVTETGQPMLAPVADLAHAQAYVKNPADSYLLTYNAPGPWVTPENPPWYEQSDKLYITRQYNNVHEKGTPRTHTAHLLTNPSQLTKFAKNWDASVSNAIGDSKPEDLKGTLGTTLQNCASFNFNLGALRTFVIDPVRGTPSTISSTVISRIPTPRGRSPRRRARSLDSSFEILDVIQGLDPGKSRKC